MSVCVVAQYPWRKIAELPGIHEPGVVICSDTRAVSQGRALPWLLAKQSHVARNIVVCYTTAHGQAISLALHNIRGTRSVKLLGEALQAAHNRFGGFSEVLAIVWRGRTPPQMLELMPPLYRPRPRTGIIGIGHRATLGWFKNNFREDPAPELRDENRLPLIELAKSGFDGPLEFPPPSFPIEAAALHVVGALSTAVHQAGDESVALPMQLWTVTKGSIQSLQAVATSDLSQFEEVTTTREKTRLANPRPGSFPMPVPALSAVQLFT